MSLKIMVVVLQYGVKIASVRYDMHTDEYIGYSNKFRNQVERLFKVTGSKKC